MSDDLKQAGVGPDERGAEPEKKKYTCLICCCIGFFVVFLAFGLLGFLYWSLLTSFLREILVSR
jgi:hypothetical protein